MKNLTQYIIEGNIAKENETKDLIKKLWTKYKDCPNICDFLDKAKKAKVSQYQLPMSSFSIFGSIGGHYDDNSGFYNYDNIFIQLKSPKERYAIYFNDKTGQIAVAKEMHISYSGTRKDSARFLEDNGYFGDQSKSIVWLDIDSDALTDILHTFTQAL